MSNGRNLRESIETCTHVSITGDATYCITARVCSGSATSSLEQPPGACPSKGAVAIADCLESSPSYISHGNCVASVDAHCVISAVGHWDCVFPDTESLSASNSSKASTVSATAFQTSELATSPTPAASSGTSSANNEVALSAVTAGTTTTTTPSPTTAAGESTPNATLNAVVAVACCALALVGLAVVKKKRNGAMRIHSDVLDSISSSPVM